MPEKSIDIFVDDGGSQCEPVPEKVLTHTIRLTMPMSTFVVLRQAQIELWRIAGEQALPTYGETVCWLLDTFANLQAKSAADHALIMDIYNVAQEQALLVQNGHAGFADQEPP